METNKERSGSLKLPEHGAGVGQGIEARVVALEGAHEGLRHAVGFGTRDWREARNQVELAQMNDPASGKLAVSVIVSTYHRPDALDLVFSALAVLFSCCGEKHIGPFPAKLHNAFNVQCRLLRTVAASPSIVTVHVLLTATYGP